MADRGQKMAAAWPPRAWLGLTAPHAGWLEVDDALLPLHHAHVLCLSLHSFCSPEAPKRSHRHHCPDELLRRRVERLPSPSTSLQLAKSSALLSSIISTDL